MQTCVTSKGGHHTVTQYRSCTNVIMGKQYRLSTNIVVVTQYRLCSMTIMGTQYDSMRLIVQFLHKKAKVRT